MPIHQAIFLTNEANKQQIIQDILSNKWTEIKDLKGILYSKITIDELLDEEDRHGFTDVTRLQNRSLKSMSSGEQKKALLSFQMSQKLDYIILDNPFDNLDNLARESLFTLLCEKEKDVIFIQIVHRKRDLLPFIHHYFSVNYENKLVQFPNNQQFVFENYFAGIIPKPICRYDLKDGELIKFQKVNVSYNETPILKDITWTIQRGEFWHLIGPNGSGKSTILSMITGDNPKGYGQDLTLFGKKKGTGESVWEIKDKIGYVTPSMTDLFSSRHTLEQMVISGFYDSIGLYVNPSDLQIKMAKEWLELIKMQHLSKSLFCLLSSGQQRMALIVRAMVKHPPLLILDESLAGLDDQNTFLGVSLINKIAGNSETTILYVSHRVEEGLNPREIFELIPTPKGSVGIRTTT
jgi:molybdate transport system ATP-binding protein